MPLVMLRSFLWRILANGLGLWIAARLLEGVDYGDNLWVILVAAVLFSLVNAFIKPILVLLSLPAIILTLGLFMLVINSFLLYLVTIIYPSFVIESFGSAMLTVIIIWLVNFSVSAVSDKD